MSQVTSEAPKPSPRDASQAVIAQQEAMLKALPFADTADFDDALRGSTRPAITMPGATGR